MKLFSRITNPNTRTAAKAGAVVVLMGSLSFAAVPFYDWFCRVTGYGGATGLAAAPGPEMATDQEITIRFDASLDRNMPWTFRPEQREMKIRMGEPELAFYVAHNPTDRPIAGQASYNVTPYAAGGYFAKVECFCFTEQVLMPGETVLMPVSFFVDPAILDDPEGQFVHTITLSYTFYEIDMPPGYEPVEQAALGPVAATGRPLTEAAAAATQTN